MPAFHPCLSLACHAAEAHPPAATAQQRGQCSLTHSCKVGAAQMPAARKQAALHPPQCTASPSVGLGKHQTAIISQQLFTARDLSEKLSRLNHVDTFRAASTSKLQQLLLGQYNIFRVCVLPHPPDAETYERQRKYDMQLPCAHQMRGRQAE